MARILVVDDEEGLREFIAEAVEADGHGAVQADTGHAATALLRRESFDLLITDLRMPGPVDGMALLRQARTDYPEMEVIVITAYGSVASAVEAMKFGAFDYLQKPLSGPAELRLLVTRAVERRRLLTLRDRSSREREEIPPLTYGDPAMQPVIDALRKVATTETTVLLLGESGTGKEVAARTLHATSRRFAGPFVAMNCAAVSDSLLESELFGHERGAFTGAVATRRGRIELADGGTLFLDEIGELKLELQTKLLRVLQERRFERVGGTRTLQADVRWVAATNRDLTAMLEAGTFRRDLYHRLAVFPVHLPPLRERRADIEPLARTLLERVAAQLGRPALHLDPAALAIIVRAEWSGNVRELANALERAAILADGHAIGPEHLPVATLPLRVPTTPAEVRAIADVERDAIEQALVTTGGNRRMAAERLGIGVRTLYDKLKRYGIG